MNVLAASSRASSVGAHSQDIAVAVVAQALVDVCNNRAAFDAKKSGLDSPVQPAVPVPE